MVAHDLAGSGRAADVTTARCPLLGRVAELIAPRSRIELALVVAEWSLIWCDDSSTNADGRPPRDLFRDDEVAVVESLTMRELYFAGASFLGALADLARENSEHPTLAHVSGRGEQMVRNYRMFVRPGRLAGTRADDFRTRTCRRVPRAPRARRRVTRRARARSPGREPPPPDTDPSRIACSGGFVALLGGRA